MLAGLKPNMHVRQYHASRHIPYSFHHEFRHNTEGVQSLPSLTVATMHYVTPLKANGHELCHCTDTHTTMHYVTPLKACQSATSVRARKGACLGITCIVAALPFTPLPDVVVETTGKTADKGTVPVFGHRFGSIIKLPPPPPPSKHTLLA
jgi:hypothetical protein